MAAPEPLLCPLYPQANAHRGVLDLSGLWEFQPDPEDCGVSQRWYEKGLPAPRLAAVPGSWGEQFSELRDYLGPCWYTRRVTLPATKPLSSPTRVLLRVGAATYHATVWLASTLLTVHEGGHLPFQVDVTAVARGGGPQSPAPSSLLLALRVEGLMSPTRVPPGNLAQIPQQHPNISLDFFPQCGIHRDVTLLTIPASHIEDVTVVSTLQSGAAAVSVSVAACGAGDGCAVDVSLWRQGKRVASETALLDGRSQACATLQVTQPLLWSPASPSLYELRLALRLDAAQPLVADSYVLSVGIRTVHVQGDTLLLNGQPLALRGFGKHEDAPLSGRALNLPAAVKDAQLMKWTGANSYRTAHYPHSEASLDVADALGLAVIGETPACYLCFHDGQEAQAARTAAAERATRELIARDKNRACVILWSLANEPEANEHIATHGTSVPPPSDQRWKAQGRACFERLFSLARSLDATRPLTFAAHPHSDISWIQLCDVVCTNRYNGWYSHPGNIPAGAAKLAASLDEEHALLQRPFVLSEFGADAICGTHAEPAEMWSEEYQQQFLAAYLDLAQGRPWLIGFHVWNLTDFKTPQAIRRPGGINHKGVFTRDRRPKIAAHFLRARWTPEQAKEAQAAQDSDEQTSE